MRGNVISLVLECKDPSYKTIHIMSSRLRWSECPILVIFDKQFVLNNHPTCSCKKGIFFGIFVKLPSRPNSTQQTTRFLPQTV